MGGGRAVGQPQRANGLWHDVEASRSVPSRDLDAAFAAGLLLMKILLSLLILPVDTAVVLVIVVGVVVVTMM